VAPLRLTDLSDGRDGAPSSSPPSTSPVRPVPEAIAPEVYAELRRIARCFMRRERPEHTLQPTALVHEALLRMAGSTAAEVAQAVGIGGARPERQDPAFVALAARVMRQVLVDHARRRGARKRSGGVGPVTGGGGESAADPSHGGEGESLDLLALDDALRRLAEVAPRAAKVVELRFFAGLEVEDAARAIGISPATVKRDWTLARAWLRRELSTGA
jgi:RNA polymerase sigma-70 factor, ECF subfamily